MASPDAPERDAALDAAHHDAPLPVDAPPADVAAACAIAAGVTPLLDGTGDLAAYPVAQHVSPGAMLGADGAALAWDRDRLYLTVTSTAFTTAYEPLHVYVQAGTELGAVVPGSGKEYSGLTARLPFTPTHLIAARQVSGAGAAAYDGVYVPGTTTPAWTTRETPLVEGTDVFVSTDHQTLSISVPWVALGGCPTQLRLAVHVVHAVAGNEWKDLIPTTHTPWVAPGGGYYELDLTAAPAITNWTLR